MRAPKGALPRKNRTALVVTTYGSIGMKHLMSLAAAIMASVVSGSPYAEAKPQYVQIAEIEVDPAQVDAYNKAVKEHIETAVRVEAGVLALYAAAVMGEPFHVRVFEIYKDEDAYKAHLESPHFKKYKTVTDSMVTSLKLVRTSPIVLGTQPNH